MTDEELQREYLENAIKEQRIREKKRKIRRCMALFEIGILLLALFFVFFRIREIKNETIRKGGLDFLHPYGYNKRTQQNIRFGVRQIFRKGIPLIFSGIPFLFQLS